MTLRWVNCVRLLTVFFVGLIAFVSISENAYSACVADTSAPGCVHFVMRTNGDFSKYDVNPSTPEKQWFQTHFWEMMAFSPSFDSRLSWFPRALVYFELYGIPINDPLVHSHPEWILKDHSGNWLYINFNCSGGKCSQWAFDFSNAAFRTYQINRISKMLKAGYRGLWLDNVDLGVQTSNGVGTTYYPVDSHTGKVMTASAWENYIAAFATEIRQAFPTTPIVHNAVWFAGTQPVGSDPYVKQEIQAADWINLERGFNGGNYAGPGQFSISAFFSFIDYVHSLGRHVIVEEYEFDKDYGLAGYYLISQGLDGFADDAVTPNNWYAGYDANLGNPLGEKYSWNGVYRRDFSNGVVLLNPRNAPPVTVTPAGTFKNSSGNSVTSVTLSGAQGAVLIGSETHAGQEPIRINAGGPNAGTFMADGDFTYGEGMDVTISTPISTSGVANAAPAAVYQTSHQTTLSYPAFNYRIPNLTPNASYTVRLHFASDDLGAGQRLFNVLINATPVLKQFDVNKAAGESWKALVESKQAVADSLGAITITFQNGTLGRADVRAIEVIPNFGIHINVGGDASGSFIADNYYNGGYTYEILPPISLAGIINPAPQAIYQTKRMANTGTSSFSYVIPTPSPNTNYLVRLHFADNASIAAGQRVFNVIINGTTVLKNFDIFSKVGALAAIVEQFTVNSGTSAAIEIQFQNGSRGKALVNGIEVELQ